MSRSILYFLAGAFVFQVAAKFAPDLSHATEAQALAPTVRSVAKTDPTRRPTPPRGLPMAMVLVHEPTLPTLAMLRESLDAARPALPFASEFAQEGDTITFNLGQAVVAVSLARSPIAGPDLEAACQDAPQWPDACARLRGHAAQLIVALTASYVPPLERAMQLSHATAAVMNAAGALGVYWGESGLVHAPEQFLEQIAQSTPASAPVHLWVRVETRRERDGSLTAFTDGLARLGFRELELRSRVDASSTLSALLADVTRTIVAVGRNIDDGEVLASRDEGLVQVRVVPSMWGHGRLVYSLELTNRI